MAQPIFQRTETLEGRSFLEDAAIQITAGLAANPSVVRHDEASLSRVVQERVANAGADIAWKLRDALKEWDRPDKPSAAIPPEGWFPMETAPTDGTVIQLNFDPADPINCYADKKNSGWVQFRQPRAFIKGVPKGWKPYMAGRFNGWVDAVDRPGPPIIAIGPPGKPVWRILKRNEHAEDYETPYLKGALVQRLVDRVKKAREQTDDRYTGSELQDAIDDFEKEIADG